MVRSTKIFALFFMVPVLFFTAALQTEAIPLRSITTVQWDYYLSENPENVFKIEEAGIYRLDTLSLVAKAEWKDRPGFTEIKGMWIRWTRRKCWGFLPGTHHPWRTTAKSI
ncbi:MAG: hypothetical protein ACLFQW_12345 [Spirochaetaceae bacterium]